VTKEIIATEQAPAAVGPYSQAVKVGTMVYTSGQIGLNPDGSGLVDGLEAQSHQVLKNLSAVLEAAGSSLDQVVKTTVFLSDTNDYKIVNGIYAEYFPGAPPARSAIEVANLPLGALVEVEAIGIVA